MDCGYETSGGVDGDEWYSVHDEIWIKACGYIEGKLPADGPFGRQILCIGCLERRIGRRLTSNDFTDAPVNKPDDSRMSYRLLTRLGWNGY
jgi:hypothetical protein